MVIIGPVGDNFAAGMTGGMAFVYDPDGDFQHRVNDDTVIYQRIATEYWETVCYDMIAAHARETQSVWAARILNEWRQERAQFWQVVPKEMLRRLEHPVSAAVGVAE